jgi:hypothetical protein
LILYNPLVDTDDTPLGAMTEILVEAAYRMQRLLLTCRDRAFVTCRQTHRPEGPLLLS